ncbi:MAG: pyridoxal-phosphate dependent enzyme [Sphingomonadaceae bacterium]
MVAPPSFADIRIAHARIAPHVHRTPLLTSRSLDALVGGRLFFKAENFQRTGSFKARGAFNAVFALTDEAAARGVATHSSGNHAAALARAAAARGTPAHVVMPETAAAPKVEAARAAGATIRFCAPTLAAREAAVEAIVAETGARLVPPFDDPLVIAGQGTAAVELIEDAPERLDLILCPVGGGGLLGGTALATRAMLPAAHLVAVEPAAADDAARGFASGVRQPQVLPVATIADGLTTAMSDLTFGLMRAHVDAVVTVSEAAIVEAMRLVWSRLKVVIEPSCAVAVAALLTGAVEARALSVGVILTGGNVDLDRLPWVR